MVFGVEILSLRYKCNLFLMRFNTIYSILLIALLGTGSCKKSNPEADNGIKNFDLYVVGTKQVDGRNYATYWKNGVEKTLSNIDSRATSIAFKGNDVYIGGAVNRPSYNTGVYWKNDQIIEIPLPDRPVSTAHGVKNIVVDGSDIYMFCEYNQYSKNGVTYDFSGYSPIDAMYVNGGKVVSVNHDLAGFYYREGTSSGGALLPDAYSIGAMLLDGNNNYVAGVKVTTINNMGYLTAGYWKNGIFEQAEPLNTPLPIIIRGMAINQNGVYIVGLIVDNERGQVPAYWHNGKINYLPIPEGTHIGAARSIVLNGNDIYIAGDANNRPCCWKNGNLNFLSSEETRGQATGIALVPR